MSGCTTSSSSPKLIVAVLICIVIVDTPYSPLELDTYSIQAEASLANPRAGSKRARLCDSYLDNICVSIYLLMQWNEKRVAENEF